MDSEPKEVVYREESYRIIGACFEVYNEMGCGFLEDVYHECLCIEFEQRKIRIQAEAEAASYLQGPAAGSEIHP